MKKIAVIHYLPLEYYPPVTNFLDVIGKEKGVKVKVWSTKNVKNRSIYTNSGLSNISRAPLVNPKTHIAFRLLKYLFFNINCLIGLIVLNPKRVLYYESYSAWPVYWYMRVFGKYKELYIHHHEYFNKEWYKKGMKLNRLYHKFETEYLYHKAIWISQTNEDRVQLFLEDNPGLSKDKMKILPNYPPKKWEEISTSISLEDEKLRIVYVGSLSLEATYIKEFCTWVQNQEGNVIFDIYSYNLHKDTAKYLNSINCLFINFYDQGVEYDNLPNVLGSYDVGIILYKAQTDNFKYNAPNKLFEYLVCNLQVWYPNKMLGIRRYENEDVVSINFEKIIDFNYLNVVFNEKQNKKCIYIADQALKPLIIPLIK
ncbi:glycosyltransferase family protein [Winogradskyella arenosi]|uniref:Glycosyltransferase involved in cell wall biosynthesis n=1 Tax=Winogradskyella arenosi TaxID=533325 RepID=A0A368ZH24_9FLAO|nr:hypothetical protein [Winogradskyella arenosi]RCW90252.1 hypothetical protein DFQ08_105141 [Winogradskyella arenosi]